MIHNYDLIIRIKVATRNDSVATLNDLVINIKDAIININYPVATYLRWIFFIVNSK